MKFKSPVFTQVSGSIAGATFAHNQGGLYMRARSIPTNPGTAQQNIVRAAMATLVSRWQTTLTAAQRAAWQTYADNVPVADVFGDPRNLSGQQHYLRSNIPAIQIGATLFDDAPTSFNLGDFTPVSITGQAAANRVDVSFDNSDGWANEDDAYMIVQASPEQSPTINFHKSPFRFIGTIEGDGSSAPTSPGEITHFGSLTAGNVVFARVRVLRADGRLSAAQIARGVTA